MGWTWFLGLADPKVKPHKMSVISPFEKGGEGGFFSNCSSPHPTNHLTGGHYDSGNSEYGGDGGDERDRS